MSNERITQALEAIEDLRQAFELWCTRRLDGPNSLDVHRSGPTAVASANAAIKHLVSGREQTEFEIRHYLNAQDARVAEILSPAVAVLPVSYQCTEPECGREFAVDPGDPMEAHGQYLDHLAEHDAEDTAEQPLDLPGAYGEAVES